MKSTSLVFWKQCVHWNERSANSDDRAWCKRGGEKDLGVGRVKIKFYCIVDSSHVACNNFRIAIREYRWMARCQRTIVCMILNKHKTRCLTMHSAHSRHIEQINNIIRSVYKMFIALFAFKKYDCLAEGYSSQNFLISVYRTFRL